jgi:hypothetical protein
MNMDKITITLTTKEWLDVFHYMSITSSHPDEFKDELDDEEYADLKFHYETLQKLKKKIFSA